MNLYLASLFLLTVHAPTRVELYYQSTSRIQSLGERAPLLLNRTLLHLCCHFPRPPKAQAPGLVFTTRAFFRPANTPLMTPSDSCWIVFASLRVQFQDPAPATSPSRSAPGFFPNAPMSYAGVPPSWTICPCCIPLTFELAVFVYARLA